MKKISIVVLLAVVLIISIVYLLFFKIKEANYNLVRKFSYDITDEKLFNETYLANDSYSFVIGKLPIQGVSLNNADSMDKSKEYIFSRDRPLKAVYLNSSIVKNEGQGHLERKPSEIVQDTTIFGQSVYVCL